MNRIGKLSRTFLKIALFALTIWYIVRKLSDVPEMGFGMFWGYWHEGFFVGLMLLTLAGMVLNWSLETIKWRFLYNKIGPVRFTDACKGVLCGAAVSIWTPNRMGDYLGRILYIPGKQYGKAIFCSFLGNFSQFIVTLVFGSAGLFYYFSRLNGWDNGSGWILLAALSVMAGALLFYLRLPAFLPWIPAKIGPWSITRYLRVLYRFSLRERLLVISLSATRFIVFSLQYTILLYAFGVELPFIMAFALVSVVFFAQSIIPSFALTEVGIRGAASLFFIGAFTPHDAGIIMATYTLWAINLIIPAALGAYFILRAGAFSMPKWMTTMVPAQRS